MMSNKTAEEISLKCGSIFYWGKTHPEFLVNHRFTELLPLRWMGRRVAVVVFNIWGMLNLVQHDGFILD